MQGDIVWYELLSPDVDASIEFYTSVIGWKADKFGPDYTMFVSSQGPVGGVGKLPSIAPVPYWQSNIEVDNLDASVAKLQSLGGKVIHKEAVETVGSFAVVMDPQGAVFALYQPATPTKLHDHQKHGEFRWNELYTSDNAAAIQFYEQMFGWKKLGAFDMGPHGTYISWGDRRGRMGGMMNRREGQPIAWGYYILADNVEATADKALARGAKFMVPVMKTPTGEPFCMLMDPQGAVFALIGPDRVDAGSADAK
ncbi:MAG: VOC family protein [Kofleriaceae bacterium]